MQLRARLEDWLSLRPALVHIYQGPVAVGGRNTRVSAGENHFAWFMKKGSVLITQENKVTRAGQGEWLIAHPGPRAQAFSEGARVISVHFQMKWPDGCNLFEEGLSTVVRGTEYPRLEEEARRLLKAMRGILPYDPLEIRKTPITVDHYFTLQYRGLGFLGALVEALGREAFTPSRVGLIDERLLGALRQLSHMPLDHSFDEKRLSRDNGLSGDRLTRRFRDAFGVTPSGYFENRRRDYARRLLGHSSIPVKEIAGNLGFRALADFSSWFKRFHHLSPREFRRSLIDAGYL